MQPKYPLKSFIQFAVALVACLLFWGCSAVSVLAPIDDKLSNGIVRFYEDGNYLKTHVYLENLTPLNIYSLRIYSVGDCRDPLRGTIGQPFDHTTHNSQRAAVGAQEIGSLGTVTADENGSVESQFTTLGSKLTGPRGESILGRSLILIATGQNEKIDQPIACGLISKNSTL
jgi:Cu/Zn superoxide dismutase